MSLANIHLECDIQILRSHSIRHLRRIYPTFSFNENTLMSRDTNGSIKKHFILSKSTITLNDITTSYISSQARETTVKSHFVSKSSTMTKQV